MSIEISCRRCGHFMRLPPSFAEGQPRCLNCGEALSIPRSDAAFREPVEGPPTGLVFASDNTDGRGNETSVVATDDMQPDNPFASPQISGDRQTPVSRGAPRESIELDQRSDRATLTLTAREVRDLLAHASTTRRAVSFFFWLLVVAAILQGLAIVLGINAGFEDSRRPSEPESLAGVVGNVVAIIFCLLTAALLHEYDSQLRTFLRTRESRALVETMHAGGRYWKWTAVAAASLVGLVLVLIVGGVVFASFYLSK